MDLSLIAAGSIDWSWWGNLAQGIGALGLVIFIHEFGHFAAAKLCGVKVEKFYIGFDFFGLRFCRFKWGETEYGIGVFPLGGYVYMFGQTDNPAKQAEEAERAKAAHDGAAAEHVEGMTVKGDEVVWDPRSYPAQSVPERMFIISAGVIMNAITAFLFAFWAYNRGAEFTPTDDISAVTPGGAAWKADLRMGDDVVEIEGVRKPRFREDIGARSAVADLSKGLHFTIHRDGVGDFERVITPFKIRPDLPPMLGLSAAHTTKLIKPSDGSKMKPTIEGSPARAAEPKFAPGDEVVQIEDVKVAKYPDIVRAETLYADRPIAVTVRRKVHGDAADAAELKVDDPAEVMKTEEVKITVAPRALRVLGLEMEMDPLGPVQDESPAAKAGLQQGDKLKSIDGAAPGDPVTLAERLRRKQKAAPGQAWKIVVERADESGKAKEVTIDVVPREADYYELPFLGGSPLSAPTLGISYGIGAKVAAVDADGPAAKAGVKAGDVFTQLKTVPDKDDKRDDGEPEPTRTIPLTDYDAHNWAAIATRSLQDLAPTTKIELTTTDDRKLTVAPTDSKEFFYVDRGFIFDSPRFTRKAESFGEAAEYAKIDARDGMTSVYKFLHAMYIGQIPKKAVGGIIAITAQASDSAGAGFSTLLLFLTMLSCNLAVLNFLPFPVLDGGHMVFLIYEGIFRRAPPQAIVNVLTIFGFICLMLLMAFALGNDVMRLIR